MKKMIFCKEPVEITRKVFDKINELMKVDFDDADTPYMEQLINTLDARPETIYASFAWEFEDGTRIIMDIESNYYTYMVRSVWENSIYDKNGYFETEYQVYRLMGFDIEDTTYVCRFKIKDEEIKGEQTMKTYRIGVAYSMYGYLTVEANSVEEALKKANEANVSLAEVEEAEYLDDSWDVDNESVAELY